MFINKINIQSNISRSLNSITFGLFFNTFKLGNFRTPYSIHTYIFGCMQ